MSVNSSRGYESPPGIDIKQVVTSRQKLCARALATKLMGGSLSVHSGGVGKRARFSLDVPVAVSEEMQVHEVV